MDPKLAGRPAFASGNINLAITTASRALTVSAEPKDKTLEPGGETKIDVVVKDSNGEPVANQRGRSLSWMKRCSRFPGTRSLTRCRCSTRPGVRERPTIIYARTLLLGNPDDVKNRRHLRLQMAPDLDRMGFGFGRSALSEVAGGVCMEMRAAAIPYRGGVGRPR